MWGGLVDTGGKVKGKNRFKAAASKVIVLNKLRQDAAKAARPFSTIREKEPCETRRRASLRDLQEDTADLHAKLAAMKQEEVKSTGVAKDDVVIVLDLYPNCLAEWAHGVFELQHEKATPCARYPLSLLPWNHRVC